VLFLNYGLDQSGHSVRADFLNVLGPNSDDTPVFNLLLKIQEIKFHVHDPVATNFLSVFNLKIPITL
jgi:hypothetical protein